MRRRSLFAEQRQADAFVNLDGTEHAWMLYDRAPAHISGLKMPVSSASNQARSLSPCGRISRMLLSESDESWRRTRLRGGRVSGRLVTQSARSVIMCRDLEQRPQHVSFLTRAASTNDPQRVTVS